MLKRRTSYPNRNPNKKARYNNQQLAVYPNQLPAGSFVPIEVKSVDTVATLTEGLYPGEWTNVSLLNGILQGNGSFARIGNKINMKSLHVRYSIKAPAVVSVIRTPLPTQYAVTSPGVRLLIVYDRMNNLSEPTILDIVNQNTINTFTKLENSDRFQVLADRYIQKDTGDYNPLYIGQIYMKFKKTLPVHFGGPNSGYSSINSGAIWMAAVSSDTVVSGDFHVDFSSRVRYWDR